MIEQDLVVFLRANVPMAQQRVWPMRLRQDPQLPALVYRRISGPRESSHSGPSRLAHPRIQIDCWGEDYPQAKFLAEELRIAVDGFRGTMGSRRVDKVEVVADLDDIDEDSGRFRIIVDIIIWHHE